jgi:hypothetical protein
LGGQLEAIPETLGEPGFFMAASPAFRASTTAGSGNPASLHCLAHTAAPTERLDALDVPAIIAGVTAAASNAGCRRQLAPPERR